MTNLARNQQMAMSANKVVVGFHTEQDDTQSTATQADNTTQQWLSTDLEKGNTTELVSKLQMDRIESGAESPDDDVAVVDESFGKDCDTLVSVPVPGKPITSKGKVRYVPNGCAICLCEFGAGDRVTWSATNKDPHVFHEDCMLKYLLSVGAKTAHRRQSTQHEQNPYRDPVELATDFPMLCPCCRQTFVSKAIRSNDVTPQSSSDETSDSTACQGSIANVGVGNSPQDSAV